MMKGKKIEAEGEELILKNEAGDYAIIPKKYRAEAMDMLRGGNHACLDGLIGTLPISEEYAEDGTLLLTDEPPGSNPDGKQQVLTNAPKLHVLVEAKPNLPITQDPRYPDYVKYVDELTGDDARRKGSMKSNPMLFYQYLIDKGEEPYDKNDVDTYFYGQAEKVKNNYPNVSVTYTYGNKTEVDSVLSSVAPGENVLVIGHQGHRMLGVPNKVLAESISKNIVDKSGVNCFLGTCSGEDIIDDFEGSGVTMKAYKGPAWYIPYEKYPEGTSLESMFYGWGYDRGAVGVYGTKEDLKIIKRPVSEMMTTRDFTVPQ